MKESWSRNCLEHDNRYWLRLEGVGRWSNVTEQQFIDAERKAGFYPTGPWNVATGGFGAHGVEGRVTNDRFDTPETIAERYAFDPEFVKDFLTTDLNEVQA